jgi:hypothetical protein
MPALSSPDAPLSVVVELALCYGGRTSARGIAGAKQYPFVNGISIEATSTRAHTLCAPIERLRRAPSVACCEKMQGAVCFLFLFHRLACALQRARVSGYRQQGRETERETNARVIARASPQLAIVLHYQRERTP